MAGNSASRLLGIGCAIVLLSCPDATRAAARATAAPVPLIHLDGIESSCAQAFPAIPGQQRCVSMGFYDTDVWVFRDRSGSFVQARQATPGIEGAGTPLGAVTRRGPLTGAAWAALPAALAAAEIGNDPGRCNPLLPLLGVPPDFPRPVFRARIVWYGRALRTHVVELGTDFPDLCSPELRDLVSLLGHLGDSLPPAP